MEPVTHILTGACLARAACNRKAAYATLTMAVAAEFPDIDTLWSLRGPVEAFAHHRGITHTFLGIPFEAAFLVGLVYALHRWRVARAARDPKAVSRPLTKAPVRWGWLYGAAVLALLSHIALDWTNNYGVRPFFPFNPHWYVGSLVFIFDPLLFVVLLLALGLPSIFRLVSSEIGARRMPFRGRGFAVAALLFIAAYDVARLVEHDRAVAIAAQQTIDPPAAADGTESTSSQPLTAGRVLANPDPLSLFRWYTVTDYGPVYGLGEVDTRTRSFSPAQGTEAKPGSDAATRAAEASRLGRVYLDWSPMPLVSVSRPESDAETGTEVTFRDPRFMGDTPLLHRDDRSPLTGTVLLDRSNRVVYESLDGKSGAAGAR